MIFYALEVENRRRELAGFIELYVKGHFHHVFRMHSIRERSFPRLICASDYGKEDSGTV